MDKSRGKLVITKKGALQVEYTSKKGKMVRTTPADGEISQTILDNKEKYIPELFPYCHPERMWGILFLITGTL